MSTAPNSIMSPGVLWSCCKVQCKRIRTIRERMGRDPPIVEATARGDARTAVQHPSRTGMVATDNLLVSSFHVLGITAALLARRPNLGCDNHVVARSSPPLLLCFSLSPLAEPDERQRSAISQLFVPLNSSGHSLCQLSSEDADEVLMVGQSLHEWYFSHSGGLSHACVSR
jgi:hypothetical protein